MTELIRTQAFCSHYTNHFKLDFIQQTQVFSPEMVQTDDWTLTEWDFFKNVIFARELKYLLRIDLKYFY